MIGDGEAETGPLATSWHGNKFLNPRTDGAVLPILHLNGYKIANPTVLARIPEEELEAFLAGHGYEPLFFTGGFEDEDRVELHGRFAATLDEALDRIAELQRAAREEGDDERRPWPAIVFRTPKGWTGPKEVDGKPVEGSWRSHQVPLDRGARRTPTTAPSWRSGCAATDRRSSSTTTVGSGPSWPRWRPRATAG